ncbi:MAG: hypothetical protein NUV77_10010 [Thermoguttaceae bacterium]|jgi:hypothetical protein|nr:hypothetical protein [Thermoguttaceae bacterium]
MNRPMILVALLEMALFLAASPVPAAEPTAEDYLVYHMPFVGSWKATAQEGGKTYTGTATWQLAPNGKCFLLRAELAGRPAVQDLVGYDPATKRFLDTSFHSDGALVLATLRIANLKKGQSLSEGPVGQWEQKRFGTDGTVTPGSATLSCKEMSKDRIVLVWSDRVEGGKTLPDWKFTYERQQAPSADAQKAFQELAALLVGGVWEYELPNLPKVTHTYRWKIKDRFLEMEQTGGDGPRHSIVGLDPQTGKPRWWTFKEDGAVNVMTATVLGKGSWSLEGTETGPKGPRTMRAAMKRVGDDRIEVLVLAVQPDPDGVTGSTEVWKRRR